MHIPSDQAIRERAYQLWERDGRPDGRSVDYWLEAAKQLEDEGLVVADTKTAEIAAPRLSSAGVAPKPPKPTRKGRPGASAKRVAAAPGEAGRSAAAKGIIPEVVRNAP